MPKTSPRALKKAPMPEYLCRLGKAKAALLWRNMTDVPIYRSYRCMRNQDSVGRFLLSVEAAVLFERRASHRVCRPTSLTQTVSFQLRVKCGAAQNLDVQEFFRNRLRVGRGEQVKSRSNLRFRRFFHCAPRAAGCGRGYGRRKGKDC